MAGEAQIKLAASATTVISLTANLANGNAAGGSAMLDNGTDKYPYALATFANLGSFSAAPTEGSVVSLYMVRQDVDGTNDDTSAPSGADVESAQFVGAFRLYDTAEVQRHTIEIDLMGALKANFYVKNESGVTINAGSGTECTVKITPFTLAPAA